LKGSAVFEKEPETLLVLDQVAKRYGKTPAEVLEMDVFDLSLCLACIMEADATAAHLMKKLNKDSMPVFPVVVLRD
jgi:RecA-family ATPase